MTEQIKQPRTRNYFAEMYVAGILADAGWNVYFPKRDIGFDFIIVKEIEGKVIVRPVQVKGKYPERTKGDKVSYGFVGKLSQRYNELVLAIPFFPLEEQAEAPCSVAFMPTSQVKRHSRGVRCLPASFRAGRPFARRDYGKFFDKEGMKLMEGESWRYETTGNATKA